MENISQWRPKRFSEIIGKANEPSVRRLQEAARARRPIKGILVGPFGSGKTSVARLLMRSYVCLAPDPVTGDPCNQCRHCREAIPELNRERLNFLHWEIDCTQQVDRSFLCGIINEVHGDVAPPFLFADEIHRLSERSAQETLLKFVEDLSDGIFLAAVMTDPHAPSGCPPKILPALFDRLTPYHFALPTADELAAGLRSRLTEWQLTAEDDFLDDLVARTGGSFRACLRNIEEAWRCKERLLDRKWLDQTIGSQMIYPCASHDPFASDKF